MALTGLHAAPVPVPNPRRAGAAGRGAGAGGQSEVLVFDNNENLLVEITIQDKPMYVLDLLFHFNYITALLQSP
jgi:hypothetical protein